MSAKAPPASELLEQMEKMNDMLNAENKMMEDKIGEMNGENVEWMKKCSELQGEVEGAELQHEQALTLLLSEKTEVEAKLRSKERQFDTFKQQCLTAAKQSVDIVRKDKQTDVEALSKALEDSSEALKKAVLDVLKEGKVLTKDLEGTATTIQYTDAVLEKMEHNMLAPCEWRRGEE